MARTLVQNSYTESKRAYELFNNKVMDAGKTRFEGKGKKTNWELWVEIYTTLSSGKQVKNPEYDACFDELEHMGLIERTVRLK